MITMKTMKRDRDTERDVCGQTTNKYLCQDGAIVENASKNVENHINRDVANKTMTKQIKDLTERIHSSYYYPIDNVESRELSAKRPVKF